MIINLFEANPYCITGAGHTLRANVMFLTHYTPLRLMILSHHTKFHVGRPQIISYHPHRSKTHITKLLQIPNYQLHTELFP